MCISTYFVLIPLQKKRLSPADYMIGSLLFLIEIQGCLLEAVPHRKPVNQDSRAHGTAIIKLI